ncbi:MAG: phosphatase domain-containing protein [Bacteroidota bacterium]
MSNSDPLLILPYRSYANSERLFMFGRVVKNKGIQKKRASRLAIFLDTFRRFNSAEMASIELDIQVGDSHYTVITGPEGYFKLDTPWQPPDERAEKNWMTAAIQLRNRKEQAIADIYFPSKNASFGILSDVDDTVLQTDMNSWLKLRMLYHTFFKTADQRLPMEGMPDLLNVLAKGENGNRENPFFYVSDSPWNIYDILVEFMRIQRLPKGPLLLRDYGRQIIFNRKLFDSHKIRAISHVLEMYPDLPFIMLGDTASHDADHYLHFAKKYPDRILAIYIRLTKNTPNAQRVAKLIRAHAELNAVLVKSSSEMMQDAREKGLLF